MESRRATVRAEKSKYSDSVTVDNNLNRRGRCNLVANLRVWPLRGSGSGTSVALGVVSLVITANRPESGVSPRDGIGLRNAATIVGVGLVVATGAGAAVVCEIARMLDVR